MVRPVLGLELPALRMWHSCKAGNGNDCHLLTYSIACSC